APSRRRIVADLPAPDREGRPALRVSPPAETPLEATETPGDYRGGPPTRHYRAPPGPTHHRTPNSDPPPRVPVQRRPREPSACVDSPTRLDHRTANAQLITVLGLLRRHRETTPVTTRSFRPAAREWRSRGRRAPGTRTRSATPRCGE